MDLRAFRESHGLSLAKLALMLGLKSKGHLSDVENGRASPSIRVALQIEAWSGGAVRAVDLLAREDAALLEAAHERAGQLRATAA